MASLADPSPAGELPAALAPLGPELRAALHRAAALAWAWQADPEAGAHRTAARALLTALQATTPEASTPFQEASLLASTRFCLLLLASEDPVCMAAVDAVWEATPTDLFGTWYATSRPTPPPAAPVCLGPLLLAWTRVKAAQATALAREGGDLGPIHVDAVTTAGAWARLSRTRPAAPLDQPEALDRTARQALVALQEPLAADLDPDDDGSFLPLKVYQDKLALECWPGADLGPQPWSLLGLWQESGGGPWDQLSRAVLEAHGHKHLFSLVCATGRGDLGEAVYADGSRHPVTLRHELGLSALGFMPAGHFVGEGLVLVSETRFRTVSYGYRQGGSRVMVLPDRVVALQVAEGESVPSARVLVLRVEAQPTYLPDAEGGFEVKGPWVLELEEADTLPLTTGKALAEALGLAFRGRLRTRTPQPRAVAPPPSRLRYCRPWDGCTAAGCLLTAIILGCGGCAGLSTIDFLDRIRDLSQVPDLGWWALRLAWLGLLGLASGATMLVLGRRPARIRREARHRSHQQALDGAATRDRRAEEVQAAEALAALARGVGVPRVEVDGARVLIRDR